MPQGDVLRFTDKDETQFLECFENPSFGCIDVRLITRETSPSGVDSFFNEKSVE